MAVERPRDPSHGDYASNIALQTALNPPYYNLVPGRTRGGPRLFVMDNVDPPRFSNLLELLGGDLKRTLFNVISKSGETAETAAQFLIVRDLLRRHVEAIRRVAQKDNAQCCIWNAANAVAP